MSINRSAGHKPKMMNKTILIIFILAICMTKNHLFTQDYDYPWLMDEESQKEYQVGKIPVPTGYKRIKYNPNTFQNWLQNLPLKRDEVNVKLFDGRLKSNQNIHFNIVDIDIGRKDLQQCADAVIRLYSEFLYSQNEYGLIAFNFTNGDRCQYDLWIEGYRPKIENDSLKWQKLGVYDNSYKNFRKYLDVVFIYAGSYSLSRELISVNDLCEIEVGDIFIQGGFPGHAVIIVDMAVNPHTQKKVFMIAQSYMPAQDIHILKNLENETLSPWYEIKTTDKLYTPEWTFHWTDLKRFP